jgi:hypothetical protein
MRGVKAKWAMLLVLPLCLFWVLPCNAQEVRYPIPCYEGEDLTEVREWEKTWVGQRIDGTNIDQVADFIPKGWVTIYNNLPTWRSDRMYFEIVPYKQWMPTKGIIEATKRHAPIAREKGFAGKDNDELVTYETEAGFPFPDPKTGLEVVWNMHFQNEGESKIHKMDKDRGGSVDMKSGYEREPKPMLPKEKNKKNIRWSYVREFYHPATTKGNRLLTIRFNTHDKPDGSWSWLSQFKRIRRRVSTQKMDTIDGTDMAYEDNEKYNNKLQYQTYKLLGRKDMLVSRNQQSSEWQRATSEPFWTGVKRERIKTYVVEATPKDDWHVYSKRIWYIDPEVFLITWREAYDRLGKYWRVLEFKFRPEVSQLGDTPIFYSGNDQADVERIHGGGAEYTLVEMSPDIDLSMYTLRGLRKGAY